MTSRRSFLKNIAVAGAAAGIGPAFLRAENERAEEREAGNFSGNRKHAKNLIFMVCDGMNVGALAAARHFQKLVLGRENFWLSLFNTHPVARSLAETSSATGIVTDSSAASSCWGCGRRVFNGKVNISPEGKPLEPILVTARRAGFATGLVSTATITHATPAGFAANSDSRNDESVIARQYLERGIDVLLGGGKKFFDDALCENFRKNGYSVFSKSDELLRVPAAGDSADKVGKMLGLFAGGHLPFSIDRARSPELQAVVPTLAEMAGAALAQLSKNAGGFVLQIEGARIDMAAHGNDAAALIRDLIAFDEAVAVAAAFAEKSPDTLLVITTDHGTGGFNINGTGRNYAGTTEAFCRLAGFTRSQEQMQRDAGGLAGAKLGDYLFDATGIRLTPPELEAAKGLKSSVLQKVFQPHTSIGWTSGNHTGDLVELTALGAGSARFEPFLRNDQIHGILLETLDIKPPVNK